MPDFHFKQFSIAHDKCAMKVGTDGVLIGAWANHQNPLNILDIGTGSGLICFMMAQRFPDSIITGIDIDDDAIEQAQENRQKNRWSDRITFTRTNLSDISSVRFDLIVSNPPFYNGTNTSGNAQRDLARQNISLPPALLFNKVVELLNKNGSFCCIIPREITEEYETLANEYNLYVQEKIAVKGNPDKEVKRILLRFGKQLVNPKLGKLTIETNKRHEYTNQYLSLINEFYLFA